jgi:UTP--glucose-1-phosphate uridylyltransferase
MSKKNSKLKSSSVRLWSHENETPLRTKEWAMLIEEIDDSFRRAMERKRIDIDLTISILKNFNMGKYDSVEKVSAIEIPVIDEKSILNMTGPRIRQFPARKAKDMLSKIAPEINLGAFGCQNGSEISLREDELETIGVLLFPYLSYGVLNGGSATSYADEKKNAKGYPEVFPLLKDEFYRMAEVCQARPKGLTPAFIQPDGTPGPSFLELKMRSLLLDIKRYRETAKMYKVVSPKHLDPLAPFFQMTSVFNDEEINQAYKEYRYSPYLQDLIKETGINITKAIGAAQPMIAAYTHSEEGRPKGIFDRAWGKKNSPLGLPGGHGQNISILKETYQHLHKSGKKFFYLGNVDNLGFTVSPVSLALVALSGKQAGFDFSFRTPVDIKGGILVRDQHGGLNCGDIGPAISHKEVLEAEKKGKKILFNCATGLFSLDYLLPNIDWIIDRLPMRFSDQDKDAGRYSQAEQVTWEIIGMLENFVVFGIDKYERFIAAKMLMETLFSSGINLENVQKAEPSAKRLHDGLKKLLAGRYALKQKEGRWVPE